MKRTKEIFSIISLLGLLMLGSGCHHRAKTMQQESFSIRLIFSHEEQLRPPLRNIYVDMAIKNSHTQPQWLLMPLKADWKKANQLNSHTLQEYEVCNNEGCFSLLEILGKQSFFAIRLKAKAKLNLRQVPIRLWEEGIAPESLEMTYTYCESISFAAHGIEYNFKETKALGSGNYDFSARKLLKEVGTDDLAEIPIEITDVMEVTAKVESARK